MKGRAGSTLIELVTALTVLGIISVACAVLMQSQARLLRYGSERAAADETLRAATSILRAELQDLTREDRHAVVTDSIALRAFRGFGIVCALNQARVTLRYQGLRQPDASKDSLLLPADETTGTIRQVSSRADPCLTRSNEQLVAIEPDVQLAIGSLVLFFESGAYHFSTNALRYRRGPSGLQPITDDRVDHARSHFVMDSSGRTITVTVATAPAVVVHALRKHVRIGFRNP
jgi:hypothetical protein